VRDVLNLVVVGMGYVGIPVAALFADQPGFGVTGIQRRSPRSAWKIDCLNEGKSPIGGDEPGLDELISRVVKKGTFRVTDDTEAYRNVDAIIIAVQTPVDRNHKPLYDSLRQVCDEIGVKMSRGVLISVESTVAPGTTDNVVKPILEDRSGLRAGVGFNLVSSPERVMVGRLIHNLTKLDRAVGGVTPGCTGRGIELYRHIVQGNLHPTNAITAEVAKVTENTYRDVNIAFANEVAQICESLGVDVHEVRKLVNNLPNDPSSPHANPYRNMHIPGAGVGGHCLPKDPWLLKYGVDTYGAFKFNPRIIVESRKVNDGMPRHMRELTVEALAERGMSLREARIAVLGLAFLENSDDPRNTPAEPLYNSLKGECGELIVHDPYIKDYEGISLTNNLEEAVKGKDCLVLVTRHREYLRLRLDRLKRLMRTPIIVDGRNAFSREECLRRGFTFRGVGIPRKSGNI
jgi:UDP-N-acetyl-D-mannosaminuronic acid dehydrogenase